jgi:hypothetical protein
MQNFRREQGHVVYFFLSGVFWPAPCIATMLKALLGCCLGSTRDLDQSHPSHMAREERENIIIPCQEQYCNIPTGLRRVRRVLKMNRHPISNRHNGRRHAGSRPLGLSHMHNHQHRVKQLPLCYAIRLDFLTSDRAFPTYDRDFGDLRMWIEWCNTHELGFKDIVVQ